MALHKQLETRRSHIEASLKQHKDDFEYFKRQYVQDTKPFTGRYGDLDLTDPFNRAWVDTEIRDRQSLKAFNYIFRTEITKRGGKIIDQNILTRETSQPEPKLDTDNICQAKQIQKGVQSYTQNFNYSYGRTISIYISTKNGNYRSMNSMYKITSHGIPRL